MNTGGLSPVQHKVLNFVDAYIAKNGWSPSFQEIVEGVGAKSKAGVSGTLDRLEQRGFLHRVKGQKRSIIITGERGNLRFLPADLLARLTAHCAATGYSAHQVVALALTQFLERGGR